MTKFRVSYTFKNKPYSCLVDANSIHAAVEAVKKGLKLVKKTGSNFNAEIV